MEALLVMNSILAGVSLYFLKYFLAELREVSKKVERLDHKVRILSGQTDSPKSNPSQPGNRRHWVRDYCSKGGFGIGRLDW